MLDDSMRFSAGLNNEQRVALRACADGNSLRFEKTEIVQALVVGSYVSKNVAGVIKITPTGLAYLRKCQYAPTAPNGREAAEFEALFHPRPV